MLINWDQPKVVLLVWGMWVLINLVVLIYMNLTLTQINEPISVIVNQRRPQADYHSSSREQVSAINSS